MLCIQSLALNTSDQLLKCVTRKVNGHLMLANEMFVLLLYLFRGKINSYRKQKQSILSDTEKHLVERMQECASPACQLPDGAVSVGVLVSGEGWTVCSDSRKASEGSEQACI